MSSVPEPKSPQPPEQPTTAKPTAATSVPPHVGQPAPTVPDLSHTSPYDIGLFFNLGPFYRSTTMEWGNGEYADFGELFDQWSDLIDGVGKKIWTFGEKYAETMKRRVPDNAYRYGGYETTLGINPYNRRVEIIRRGDVTITVLIAKQADDLYVSWRAYVQGLVSSWRVVAVALTLIVITIVSSNWLSNYNSSVPSWAEQNRIGEWVIFIIPAWILARLFIFEGILRRRDWLGWFRDPIIPMQYDNAIGLSLAVHRTILEAADLVGIESVKLQPRQPLYALRKPLI